MRPSNTLFQDITESYLGLTPESEKLVMFEKVGKNKYIKWVGTVREDADTPQVVNNANVDNTSTTVHNTNSSGDNANKVNSEIQLVPVSGVDDDLQSSLDASYEVVSNCESVSDS